MYTNLTISMDSDLKEKADVLFSELGMDLSTAFNLFVKESLRVGGIPFELTPNKETIEVMEEAKRMTYDSSVKGYDNLDELFEELKSLAPYSNVWCFRIKKTSLELRCSYLH